MIEKSFAILFQCSSSMPNVKTVYTRHIRAQKTDSVPKKDSENLIHFHGHHSVRKSR
jgi:hypothetical protein